MNEENTERTTEPTTPDRAADVAATDGRVDDRNSELEGSPVPDPEADEGDAIDDPGAD